MSKNLTVSLYVVFLSLAIVSKLGGGIEHIAYAKIWGFSPTTHNQPVNNLQNKNQDSGCAPTLKVPSAHTTKYHDIIKAVSMPSMNKTQKICATNHDDYIIGSEGNDIIFGLRGNDVITALGGNDLVFAGPSDDRVYGGDGNNHLFGEDDNDNLIGGTADDLLVGGSGNDRLYGNAGDDILQGGPGADYFDCGDGLDTVVDYSPTEGDVISSNCENH
jgi:hypothetical protein